MSWASKIPEELLHQPKALIALSGLDATFNAVHKSLVDAFANLNRSERVGLRFKLFPGDHEYPKAKSRRTSYEWYVPKGILKTNWMRKHLEEIPAVVAIFFDLDWDEPQWRERQMECATRVEIVRKSLQGRGTKVAVVLIQKRTPLPPGEDMQATERAQAICAACELSAKNLFVLPQSDHLMGYIIRLENAFAELAYSYYQGEAKKIKAHKEFLNKTTHQLLFVRHQFKIAFINEMKQDVVVALKHYRLAYNHILDLRMHEAHLLEIKTVAGFINYKVCKLAFQQNSPLDAIPHFRKHIEHFKHRAGIQGLEFEHAAWMSKQFEIFGDLFHEAIRQGLAALQTQHPGFYYHQAAKYAISRKDLSRAVAILSPGPDGSVELPTDAEVRNVEFYGQRPWRPGNQSIDPPDPHKEREGIAQLQLLEREAPHAAIIIPLLNSAVAQFKRYRSPRMRQYLLVTMGEEHFDAGEFRQALSCLSLVVRDYRREGWWAVLTAVLVTSLKCAYLTANAGDYANIGAELLEASAQLGEEEKRRVQGNWLLLLQGRAPQPEPSCDLEAVESARTLWAELLQSANATSSPISVEMALRGGCVECMVAFEQAEYEAASVMALKVHLRTSCPQALTFQKLAVRFTNATYDARGVIAKELTIEPGAVTTQQLILVPERADVGQEVRVSSLELQVFQNGRPSAVLRWTFEKPSLPGSLPPPSGPPLLLPPEKGPAAEAWAALTSRPAARVQPRCAQLSIEVEQAPPALVNEFYRLPVLLRNDEPFPVTDLCLSVAVVDEEETAGEGPSTHLSLDRPGRSGAVVARLEPSAVAEELEPGESRKRLLFVQSVRPGSRRLRLAASYTVRVPLATNDAVDSSDLLEQAVTCAVTRNLDLEVPVIEPFSAEVGLRTRRFRRTEHVLGGQPFLLLLSLRNVAPWTLEVADSCLTGAVVRPVGGSFASQVRNLRVRPLDAISEAQVLVVPEEAVPMGGGPPVPVLGRYCISWRRAKDGEATATATATAAAADDDDDGNNAEETPFTSTEVALPLVEVRALPLHVTAQLPAFGRLRQALSATYALENRTPYPKEVEAQMEPTDGFMFAGNRHCRFRVLPHARYLLCYNLYPLETGEVALPRLQLQLHRNDGAAAATSGQEGGTGGPWDDLTSDLPRSIFVKPCGSAEKNAEKADTAVVATAAAAAAAGEPLPTAALS